MADAALKLWYYFATQKTLAARQGLGPTLDIVRTTEKYHYNSAGILVAAASGVAAFDHDPVTLQSLGLSVHEARTNLALFSRDMSNAAHVATNITKGSTSVLDPTNTANVNVRLTASTGNGTLLQSVTSASANRAFAPYIKRVTGSGNIQLTVDGGATWTTVTVTADWTRLPITQLAVTNPQFGVRIVTSGDAIDYWGPDLQTGTFITPHIPTVASSVTRNADVINSSDVTWYNNAEGTLYLSGSVNRPRLDTDAVVIDSGGTANRFRIGTTDSGGLNKAQGSIGSGGSQVATLLGGTWAIDGTSSRMALGAKVNDFEFYHNGSRSGTGDQVGAMPVGINNITIGSRTGGGLVYNGHIAEIRYYNERKDNQFLEDLSNGLISEGGTFGGDGDGIIWWL